MSTYRKLNKNIYEYESISQIKLDTKNAAKIISSQNCIIVKNVFKKGYCNKVIKYLERISKNSFPNYHPLTKNTPNHFRLNYEDTRASVKGYFMQFNIFLKNQDILETAVFFRDIFKLKDQLSYELSNKTIKFDSMRTSDDYISRVGYQFYQSGKGYLEGHRDFVGDNQRVVPSLVLSKKGKDFKSGGFYLRKDNGEFCYPEEYVEKGDIILFRPDLFHGVEIIDKELIDSNDEKFHGRWMAFITTTKTT